MPYLPPNFINETTMPEPYGKDVLTAARIMEEEYTRFHPIIDYYQMNKAVTPQASDGTNADVSTLIGETGGQKFDPLYGETIDGDLTEWDNPHRTTVPNVGPSEVDADVFHPAVQINARIQREAKDEELKHYGFDKIRDLLIFIPLSLLDKKGITVQAGDKFQWDDQMYNVLQYDRKGYWQNTNVRLVMAINAEHRKIGS